MLINNIYGRFASFFKNYELKEADKYIKRVFPNAEFYIDYEHALVFERIGEDKEIDLDYHTVINGVAYDGTFTSNYNELVKYWDESKVFTCNGNKYTPIPRDVNMDMELLGAGNHLFVFAAQFDFKDEKELTPDEIYLDYRRWYLDQGYLEKFILTKDRFFKRIEQEFRRADKPVEKVHRNYGNVFVNIKNT